MKRKMKEYEELVKEIKKQIMWIIVKYKNNEQNYFLKNIMTLQSKLESKCGAMFY